MTQLEHLLAQNPVERLNQAIMHGGEQAFEVVPIILDKVIAQRLWAAGSDKDGTPFKSFESFVTHRRPQGLESNIDELLAFCRRHEEVQKLIRGEVEPEREHRGATKEERENRDSNTTSSGRGATYLLKRLKRDIPALFERVVKGELTANAAAIEAGFRERTITITANPAKAARSILKNFTRDEIDALITALGGTP